MLAIRELSYGIHRFDQLVAFTGAPRDILTIRLRRLEQMGVIERRPYEQRPLRHEYHLTEAGKALYPTVLALMEWGDAYAVERPTLRLIHNCGVTLDISHQCAACGGGLSPETVMITPNV